MKDHKGDVIFLPSDINDNVYKLIEAYRDYVLFLESNLFGHHGVKRDDATVAIHKEKIEKLTYSL